MRENGEGEGKRERGNLESWTKTLWNGLTSVWVISMLLVTYKVQGIVISLRLKLRWFDLLWICCTT